MSTSAQVLRQAEALKAAVSESGSNEAWVSRQTLQDLYQKLLVVDLEYALDKKVEQDLWNNAFKNQINAMQTKAKDKQNVQRSEIQASLNLFLETASGFYIQLLQELCTAFDLDLPFRRKSSFFGVLKEHGQRNCKIRTPKKSSSLYICQHCLVHLGDIARYRQQIEQAQMYYRHAAHLVPYNGQPYNQLAILEAAKGNKLATVYYYIRSIAVKHPFPVAATNLEKSYTKIAKETLDFRGNLSMSEIMASFLQFQAMTHLCTDHEKAKKHSEKLILSLPTHISSMSFSSYQLVQMVAINLFTMFHAKQQLSGDDSDGGGVKASLDQLSQDELRSYQLVFSFTVNLLDNLLHLTPKQEQKAKEYHTLPAINVIFDWLRVESDNLSNPIFKNSTIWPNFSKLLNNLQFHATHKDHPFEPDSYKDCPLQEDVDLQCFLPISKYHSRLNFRKASGEGLPVEVETKLRCHRLLEHGRWVCEQFPSLNLLSIHTLKSGKLQFTAPTAHIKVLTGGESESGQDKKSHRQNVAIQAIMQSKQGGKTIRQRGDMQDAGMDSNRVMPDAVPHGKPQGGGHSPWGQQQHQQQQQQTMMTATPAQGSPSQIVGAPRASSQMQGNMSSVWGAGGQSSQQPQQHLGNQPPQRLIPNYPATDSLGGFAGGSHGGPQGSPQTGQKMAGPSQQQIQSFLQQLTQQAGQLCQQQGQMQNLLGGFPGLFSSPGQQQTSLQQPQTQQQRLSPGASYQTQQARPGAVQQPGSVGSQRGGSGMPVAPPGSGLSVAPPTGGPPLTGPSPSHQHRPGPGQQQQALPARHENQFARPNPMPVQLQQIFAAMQNHQNLAPGNQQQMLGQLGSIGHANLDQNNLGSLSSSSSDQIQPEILKQILSLTNQPAPGMGQSPAQLPSSVMAAHQQVAPLASQHAFLPGHEDFSKEEPELLQSLLALGMKPSPGGQNVPPQFPVSSRMMPVDFADLPQGVPKPDSPINQSRSLFSDGVGAPGLSRVETGQSAAGGGSYSLFSQSPWSVPLKTGVGGGGGGGGGGGVQEPTSTSLDSSPFTSQTSSVRSTPDPYAEAQDPLSSSFNLGYSFGSSDGNWMAPPSPKPPEVSSAAASNLLSSNIQSLWSSGPSPLEKLLEQQKMQRQGDPH